MWCLLWWFLSVDERNTKPYGYLFGSHVRLRSRPVADNPLRCRTEGPILNHMVAYREDTLDAVFSALGDPTRRRILLRLRGGVEASASTLAEPFPISLPGFIKHLQSLQRAGLVGQRKQGRERLYWLLPEPLKIANQWLAEYEVFWNAPLDSLNAYIQRQPHDET